MFTGIITELGTVTDVGEHRLDVHAPACALHDDGASIAVNGCCLTIARRPSADVISFDILPDTIAKTSFVSLAAGDTVNLEPAASVGQPMGGHWVQGHVDAVGVVQKVVDSEQARDLELEIPEEVLRYCIERGSLAVNGVSLTIMTLLDHGVRLSLIPETRTRTNLGALQPGGLVNLEADILARYVERLLRR